MSGSRDSTLKSWDVQSGRCLATWSGHVGSVLQRLSMKRSTCYPLPRENEAVGKVLGRVVDGGFVGCGSGARAHRELASAEGVQAGAVLERVGDTTLSATSMNGPHRLTRPYPGAPRQPQRDMPSGRRHQQSALSRARGGCRPFRESAS